MPDKITTLKLIDNTDVFPNIKDENIPDTIMRIADLSKYLNQLKSINIPGDIVSTTIASDIATFTNVHVDGNLFVNGLDNIVDKNGNKVTNTIIGTDLRARMSRIATNDIRGMFSNLPVDYSGKFFLAGKTNAYASKVPLQASFLFSNSYIINIDLCDWLNDVMSFSVLGVTMEYAFSDCPNLITIASYDIRYATTLEHAFENDINLKEINLLNIPVSFDISVSTKFEESDLVKILGNLMDLTGKTSQTLTMGATNLAKLTDSEKAIATNKNWILA